MSIRRNIQSADIKLRYLFFLLLLVWPISWLLGKISASTSPTINVFLLGILSGIAAFIILLLITNNKRGKFLAGVTFGGVGLERLRHMGATFLLNAEEAKYLISVNEGGEYVMSQGTLPIISIKLYNNPDTDVAAIAFAAKALKEKQRQ
ncbi:MAG: hypothetical protein PHR36_02340 [Patescibacteria group bacterium]|nr:hypothetical protein [Patescibacteria group bacterium]